MKKNPGISAAEVHLNSHAVGPELVPKLSESDVDEHQGTVKMTFPVCAALSCTNRHSHYVLFVRNLHLLYLHSYLSG